MKRKLLMASLVLSLTANALFVCHYAGKHYLPRKSVYDKSVEKCVESWNNSVLKSNPAAENIFIGSSSTYLAPTDSIPNSVNLGYWGDKLKGMCHRLKQVTSLNPKRIFIFPSTNGYETQSDEEYLRDFKELVGTARDSFPRTGLYVISTFPMAKSKETKKRTNARIITMCRKIKAMSQEMKYVYIDVSTPLLGGRTHLDESETVDGLHLTPQSYEIWLESVKNVL